MLLLIKQGINFLQFSKDRNYVDINEFKYLIAILFIEENKDK